MGRVGQSQSAAKYELHFADRRQLEQDRMSSYTDDAFECESPNAILAGSGIGPTEERCDQHATESAGSSPYLVLDNIDRLCSISDSGANQGAAYEEFTQPRPEIILRRKRFAVLVVITAATMSAIAAWLREGFVVKQKVPIVDAETKTDTVNSYIGLMMGFVESIVGLGVEEIFPVFLVYLHNLRWYPSDDPATKKQSKFKKFALTIFIPTVMMAVGSSLSAVQANQREDKATSSRHMAATTRLLMQNVPNFGDDGLGGTILKTALRRMVVPMQPLDMSTCDSNGNDLFEADMLLAAAPKALFGFPLREWGAEFGKEKQFIEAFKRYDVTHNGAREAAGDEKLGGVMSLAMAHDLWKQGNSIFMQSIRATSEEKKSSPPLRISEFFDDVLKSLLDTGVPLAVNAAVDASFEFRELSSLMDLHVMTLRLPLRSHANTSVVCGVTSCALLEPQLNFGQRLPRKQIGMAPMNMSDAAFLYAFTTVSSYNRDTDAISQSLVLSFGRISWRFIQSTTKCKSTTSKEGCQVLYHQLDSDYRHLVLPKQWLPTQFQIANHGQTVSLVQLLEPKLRLHSGQASPFAILQHLESWSRISTHSCSAVVETFLQYIQSNHFYFAGDIVEIMAASALFYIFQNAQLVDTSSVDTATAIQRRLDGTTTRRVRVFLTNTRVGIICTWTACGVLLLLTVLVIVLPNERARLAPPRGGNARAERFVLVQTEQIYPNLIYKKRFLIGKTGEEIKFGEFAVETVGLHHKMEEDEQIYL
ncbi:hypothetical protein CCR75_008574 [Bremia lactucae]|uniref:Transmembrane protein n=1 Tax=Bremia lactucae TaxID=4779 RepID=A0A976ID27_BRELC|nr:hypothetical protein CCR75_008574 [Bremia lactucae]